ncbi:PREDICTED: protein STRICTOSIDINE SYNTHASE-LIKE 10-like [Fragaria vesca subsp. vesca]|uniref:protein STRICTOSIDINE SYNTHASE-LIKE 10-like n=1 Tax=Fragaria vesca subsp. vesca TaxID=101020 RepID=UPI0002C3113C|nr:PREDICTED: protein STRICTOSIDINE SYNTHASE-LIKE 10-like [Fragaria vesca subsp. vesca]
MNPHFASFCLQSCLLIIILVSTSTSKPALAFSIASLRNYHQLDLPNNTVGPESVAFDCRGQGPYVGVSDGRILKWEEPLKGWTEFSYTSPNRQRKLCDGSTNKFNEPICGRPLGLKFNPTTCELYIADAYFGLLKTGPNGGRPHQLASSAGGVPFHFLNALDVDNESGMVYFTDTSLIFQRSVWILSIISADRTGRLMQYDPRTKKATVLLKGLAFPDGVALSKDKSFLLLIETGTLKILRLWLRGPKANTLELFAQLVGFPDNIKRNDNGEFWVAINNGVGGSISATLLGDPVGAKFDEDGNVLEVLDGKDSAAALLQSVSEVEEHNGMLWIGSAQNSYVGVGLY